MGPTKQEMPAAATKRRCTAKFCALAICASALFVACSTPAEPTSGAVPPGVLIGAGDIALCDPAVSTPAAELTARLLDRLPGTVFTAGDNAYMTGSLDEFRDCYEPTWGRHKSRTRPVPGNHEYLSAGAAPYYAYFGANAGPAGLGYYSFTVGPWRVLALNSEIAMSPGSPQSEWIQAELTTNRRVCTLAIFHRPLFSSGTLRDNSDTRDLWRVLYEQGVDVIVNGHDHIYERFAPQDPDGRLDTVRGIRAFVVGTGGVTTYAPATVRPNSEVAFAAYGVVSFSLGDGGYQWEFIPVDGVSLRDAGSGSCH